MSVSNHITLGWVQRGLVSGQLLWSGAGFFPCLFVVGGRGGGVSFCLGLFFFFKGLK